MRYPPATGVGQLGDLDLGEHRDRYRDQRLVIIIAPLGKAPDPRYTRGIQGFVMDEAMECPGCKLIIEETLRDRKWETPALTDEIEALLAGDEGHECGGSAQS